MNNNLQTLLDNKLQERFATTNGSIVHKKLERVFFLPTGATGDKDLCNKIATNPELVELMGPLSKTEVPIAGVVHGHFISRRIDRLYVSDDKKQVVVLDYKTDTDRNAFREKYIAQLTEYRELLTQVFPKYDIYCKILWTCDFTLENII